MYVLFHVSHLLYVLHVLCVLCLCVLCYVLYVLCCMYYMLCVLDVPLMAVARYVCSVPCVPCAVCVVLFMFMCAMLRVTCFVLYVLRVICVRCSLNGSYTLCKFCSMSPMCCTCYTRSVVPCFAVSPPGPARCPRWGGRRWRPRRAGARSGGRRWVPGPGVPSEPPPGAASLPVAPERSRNPRGAPGAAVEPGRERWGGEREAPAAARRSVRRMRLCPPGPAQVIPPYNISIITITQVQRSVLEDKTYRNSAVL